VFEISLVFAFVGAMAILQIWTVQVISRYPSSAHKLKRKWTGIVVAMPFFGAMAYYLFGKKDFDELES
jgi:hypothetical protein